MGRSADSTGKFRLKESLVLEFTYQFRLLLSQNYLIQDSLRMMLSINTHPRLKQMIQLLLQRLESGLSLYDSLKGFQPMDRFYLSMIHAGEQSGNLPDQMNRLLEHLEKKRLFRQKLHKASLYPMLVFSITLVAAMAFIALAVPMLTNFAESLQVPLPHSTQRFIAVLNWFHGYFYLPLFGFSLLFFLVRYMNHKYPYLVDYWRSSFPYLGRIIVEKELALFCQQMSFLLSSHLGLQESLKVAAFSMQNRYLREQIEVGSVQLSYGESISSTLRPVFSQHPFLFTALKTGEESNRLAENFAYLSGHYQQSLQIKQDRLLVLIEPLMLLTIGLFVWLIIVQFYLPIFQVLNQVDFLNTFQ